MPSDKGRLGSLVAFEGHPETISTQLRLLPTSPQVLILPNIQYYLPDDDELGAFDARIYVKKIHEAVLVRSQAARTFLQGATPNSKRLVFMNGGSAGAQVLCIRAIMEHDTDGDYARAEAILNHLVRDGVAGLDNPARDWRRRNTFEYFGALRCNELEDPITRAMRAADALDRQTASLQPVNELDLTIATRPRSNSLPLYGYADNFGDAAPFFVFGAQNDEDGHSFDEAIEEAYIPRAPVFSVTHYEKPSEKYYPGFTNLQPPSPKSYSPRSPSCIGESYGSLSPHASLGLQSALGPEVFTPRSDVFSIRSTDNVVYGEASILDMRLSGRRATLTRVKSLDRIYPATPKYRDLCLPSETAEPPKHLKDTIKEGRRHSCMVVTSRKDSLTSRLSYIEGPRTIVVRSNRPAVKVAPVPPEKKRKPARSSYVDRGTDADELPELDETFKPVLPFLEDFVVHFKDEAPDALLDSVIEGFRTGDYPVLSQSPTTSEACDGTVTSPRTPESQTITEVSCEDFGFREPNWGPRFSEADEYDPFAYVQPTSWPAANSWQQIPTFKVERPPTPAQTPPPSISEAKKIHEFNVSSQQTAVAIQNSLRSILKVHFPPESQGYRQFHFPLLPELEGLWNPIFREAEPGSPRASNRGMDQILAIGAQRGVKREYASAITGQLEKLGTKSTGMSRSGKLDFRYLLANAMQAYTALPLTSQTHDNPFSNSYLLATLVIPHLETYLALHSEVRFLLLEYPPEHLPTMLALQKLVGVDLMKVAQIVDSKSKDLLQFTHLRGTPMGSYSDTGATRLRFPSPPGLDCDISKANFLLTSTASDSEIATFISTVLKILSEISKFYAPEDSKKSPARKSKPSSLQGTFSPFPKVTVGPQSPMSPAFAARFGSLSTRTPSIAETIKTTKSKFSRKSKAKLTNMDSQSTFELSDSDWDMEDRRVMPTLVKKPEIPRGNSRKALKFLGLA